VRAFGLKIVYSRNTGELWRGIKLEVVKLQGAFEIRCFLGHKLMRHRQTVNFVQYYVVARRKCLAGTRFCVVCVHVGVWLECFSQCLIRKSAAPVEEEEATSNSGQQKQISHPAEHPNSLALSLSSSLFALFHRQPPNLHQSTLHKQGYARIVRMSVNSLHPEEMIYQ